MKNTDMVSFIILTYRNFDGIYSTLDSVFMQDYPCIEIIISDDGSDNYNQEIEKIKAYIEKNKTPNIVNVRCHQILPNGGTVNNANTAYKMAEGKYIKDLSAEDVLSCSDAISKYVEFLEKNNLYICFSKLQGIDDQGNVVKSLESCVDDYKEVRNMTPLMTRNKLFARNFLPAPAWFAKKELFEKYGYYSNVTRLIEDYPYWIHLCSEGVPFGYMDDVLINYRLSGVSSAGSYGVMFMKDMYQVYNGLKTMGLNSYYAKAVWEDYTTGQKIKAYLKYGVFFAYIKLGNYKTRRKNKKHVK